MRLLNKALASAAIGAGLLAASAMSASAAIVCTGHVCWHTHDAYDYPHGAGVVVHEDDWKWGPRGEVRVQGARGPRLLARQPLGRLVSFRTSKNRPPRSGGLFHSCS